MDKFIGFDTDHKHTPAYIVQAGQLGRYRTLWREVGSFRRLSMNMTALETLMSSFAARNPARSEPKSRLRRSFICEMSGDRSPAQPIARALPFVGVFARDRTQRNCFYHVKMVFSWWTA